MTSADPRAPDAGRDRAARGGALGRGSAASHPGGRRWVSCVGVTASALYLIALTMGWLHPVLLLYDGPAPLPPYRWVSPPRDAAADNQRPASGTAVVTLGVLESMPGDASTEDEQAVISFAEGTFAKRSHESAVKVRLTPIDPLTVAPPPKGLRFDGNAYRIVAVYPASGGQAGLTKHAIVVLRYPLHATVMLRSSRAAWASLPTTRFGESQQLAANTDQLGVFVAAAPAGIAALSPGPWVAAIAAAGALVLAVAVMRLGRRRAARP